MSTRSAPPAIHGDRVSLLRVLGPVHVWALGVGIVLVGEFTGWNFSADKGGALAALIVCWVVGLLYTSVAMIDSEVTSTVAAAGGQYAQAKHIVGPLMAFNVALFLVFAYTMLEVSDAILVGDLMRHGRGNRRVDATRLRRADDRRAGLAQLSRRADDAQRQFRHHRARLSVDPHPVLLGAAVEPGRRAASSASWSRPKTPCPMAGSASSPRSSSASGTISASKAPRRRPKRCARRPARCPTARWPA